MHWKNEKAKDSPVFIVSNATIEPMRLNRQIAEEKDFDKLRSSVGKVITLTRDKTSAFPLVIEASKGRMIERIADVKKKYTLEIDAPSYSIESNFHESICSALEACGYLLQRFPQDIRDDFDYDIFNIKISCVEIKRPFLVRGRSAGLGIALSIISCFLGFGIREGIAVSGDIDSNGNLHFVKAIKEKTEIFIKEKTFFRFIFPYMTIRNEAAVKEFYEYLKEIEKEAASKDQSLVLCSNLMEALLLVTNIDDFQIIYEHIDRKFNQRVWEELNGYRLGVGDIKEEHLTMINDRKFYPLPKKLWGLHHEAVPFQGMFIEPVAYDLNQKLEYYLKYIKNDT